MGEKKSADLPRGITIRTHRSGQTINITFTYKGVKCREPLSNLDVNSRNIKYAERLLGEIHNKMERGTFNYANQFPKSVRLKLFGNKKNATPIKKYLDEYLEICASRQLSPSTLTGYKKCRGSLLDLHNVNVADLTPGMIKNWVQQQNTALKTVRNRLSFLRSALDEAVTDGILTTNPVSLISASRYQNNSDRKANEYFVDPLRPDEVEMMLSSTTNAQWENLFRFALHTGMRSSELCALRWDSLDLVNNTVGVFTACVEGIVKNPKTKAGRRKIELNTQALLALTKQKPFTSTKSEFVFHDPKTNKPWAGADAIRKKAWIPTLKRAGIRYRNPYQTRHTFATMHISQGANLFWLASQMGHKGPEMLFRHYGAYLKEYSEMTEAVHQKSRKGYAT